MAETKSQARRLAAMKKRKARPKRSPKSSGSSGVVVDNIDKSALEDGLASPVRLVMDEGSGDIFMAATLPGSITWDKDKGLLCDNPMWRSLIMAATGGDAQKIQDLLKDGGEFHKLLLRDEEGVLRSLVLSRAITEAFSKPSEKDPLEWARLALSIIEKHGPLAEERKRLGIGEEKHLHLHGGDSTKITPVIEKILRRLDGDSEGVKKRGRPKRSD